MIPGTSSWKRHAFVDFKNNKDSKNLIEACKT